MAVGSIYLTLLEFAILVTTAESLSLILAKYKYPSIVAELLTGIALSPYALGGLLNALLHVDLFSINNYVVFLSEFSVILLLFASGLGHGLSSLKQGGFPGLMAAVAGAILPFMTVYWYCTSVGFSQVAASLIALSTAPTSLAVVANIIEREGLHELPSTKVLVAAASVDDVVALILLSTLPTSPSTDSVAGFTLRIVKIAVLWVIFLTASILLIPRLLNRINEYLVVYASLIVLFGLVVSMVASGFSAVIASFIAGVAVAESRESGRVRASIDALLAIFGSIFFITIGLQMNFKTITNLTTILQSLIVSAIAIIAKVIGVYPFAYIKLRNTSASLTASLGMVPRGEMGLVIASIGLSSSLLNPSEYGLILIMVLATTIIGSILYRRSIRLNIEGN
ncbi:cation:proton antiporter [Caldivirga maquilingensis]|uniref:Sodium/hydrogen exchanger n=1 Tax=Caldivirga maquilingensis (strain ATCC 700844 / DSM 13496 / JCM 10307 / IC-167) TaxID=397948 RepID=A8M918_CALMQ|nr:cation:proton antiporter [Caldivirga maquilingensis]ABW02237.1 sodium/hydrogen exchanger [Caldivirga maquilingensis IC-167]